MSNGVNSSELSCKDCLAVIGKLDVKIDLLNTNMMKIFFAMLGIIGANIGTKYIGTPLYIYMAIYSALFSGIFVILVTIYKRKYLSFLQVYIQTVFSLIVFYVSGLRIYHYQAGTSLTQLEGFISNILMILLAWGFIIKAWRVENNYGRRCSD